MSYKTELRPESLQHCVNRSGMRIRATLCCGLMLAMVSECKLDPPSSQACSRRCVVSQLPAIIARERSGQEFGDFADDFLKSLIALWGKITQRNPGELAAALALALGAQSISGSLPRHAARCLPVPLKAVVPKLDRAAVLLQLSYDPMRGRHLLGSGPLHEFDIVKASWKARLFEPAFVILRNQIKPMLFWIVVRGTNSVEDILTDVSAEPEKFLDGHIHSGILRSARFIKQQVQDCLTQHAPSARTGTKKASPELMVVGHSLGGGAAALATAMLRLDGHLSAHAIVFGAPSCVHRAPHLESLLRNCVTHLALEDDIVPRLNNDTIARLLAPADDAAAQMISSAKSFLFARLKHALAERADMLSRAFGLGSDPMPTQSPPGRTFLLHPPHGGNGGRGGDAQWHITQADGREMGMIRLSPHMLTDHHVSSYVDAVQHAGLRSMAVCPSATADL